jgi:nicotinamide-nucleotide amidase
MASPALAAEMIMQLAEARGLTLATAESCTAGCLALLLADTPGAGERLHGGFVVYSKEQKTAVLGVAADLIARHTAVSREVAEAMARGVIAACPADLGIAITGVAGPEPDEDGNPVGLMHIAVAHRDGDVRHRKCELGAGGREKLRGDAMTAALQLAAEVLQARPEARRAVS